MNIPLGKPQADQLAAASRQPSGAYLFAGPAGTGRTAAALELMRALNCHESDAEPCPSCAALTGGNHPDLVILAPDEKKSVTVEQVRELGRALTLEPYNKNGHRLVLIQYADTLSPQAQNALLKTLEEPPARTVFVLEAEREQSMLPTVRSRTRLLRFSQPDEAALVTYLRTQGISDFEATRAARLAPGSFKEALALARNPEQAAQVEALTETARKLTEAPLFEALVLAGQAASAKEGIGPLIDALMKAARDAIRQTGGAKAAAALTAALRLKERAHRGLTPKTSLEAYVLEIRRA